MKVSLLLALQLCLLCATLGLQAQSLTLSGSEHKIVNGIYTLDGVNQLNQPRYTHSSGDYHINYDGNGTWWLNTDKGLSGGSQYYKASGTSTEPPLTGWTNDKAQSMPLALVADPQNAAIRAATTAAQAAEVVVVKGLKDNYPSLGDTVQMRHVPSVESTRVSIDTTRLLRPNGIESLSSTHYVTNLRISYYKIQTDNGNCSFGAENPDPRYSVSTNYGNSVIVKGDDVTCDWQTLTNNGKNITPSTYNNSIPIAAGSSFSMNLNVQAWEEDGCDSDDTYDTCFFDNDDYPASTTYNLVLDPGTMTLGYNNRSFSWSNGGVTYSLGLSWEVALDDRIVTVYADANLSGRTQQFGTGEYTGAYNQALETGVGNNSISSMVIASGYKVTAYNNNNLTGYPSVFRGTVNFVEGFNDKISSLKIETDDNQPPARGKTLLIYFNGSDKPLDFQMANNASKINASQMIFIKGIGAANKNYAEGAFYDGGFVFQESEELDRYNGFDVGNPLPTTFYSHTKVFKNANSGTNAYSYLFGVDMDYDGSTLAGYEDEDSYAVAANVLRVLNRYNLRGYDTILISGHSRGAAVGIPSLLFGIKKALTNTGFSGFTSVVNDVLGTANVINVLALDPVAGSGIYGLRNDYHMGSGWHTNDIYSWLKGQYSNINFSEVYANGGRMLESQEYIGIGGLLYSNTFEPSPNYLYNTTSNNVQRYWLGFRHSSMEFKDEKLKNLYDEAGVTVPVWLTTDIMNAALNNQPLFRDYSNWYNKFRKNDMEGWLTAYRLGNCQTDARTLNSTTLYAPTPLNEILYYHQLRHGNIPNAEGGSVNMTDFVGDNKLDFQCSGNYKPPTKAGNYTATAASVRTNDAEGWTHYCSCEGELLLSIKEGTTGVVLTPSNVAVQISANLTATHYNTGQGFITSPTGSAVMANMWWTSPSIQPASALPIRTYFAPEYFGKVKDVIALNNGKPLTDTTQMWFFRATTGAAYVQVPNIPTAHIYTNGASASLTNWKLGRGDYTYYAEYLTNALSGGGGGASAICTVPIAYNVLGSGTYCKTQDATVSLANSQNNVNYQLYLNGNPVGSAVAGTGSVLTFPNITNSGTYTVVATGDATNGCITNMVGNAVLNVFNTTPTLYVNANATGTGDGSSWANAYTNLSDALQMANRCALVTAIKVAKGTYKPTLTPLNSNGDPVVTGNDRDKTFYISAGITLEGGYDAASNSRDIRANETILSGDIDNNDVVDANGVITSGNATNAHHVVLTTGRLTGKSLTIDGFSITGGNANGDGSVNNGSISFFRTAGGGIQSYNTVNTISNNTIYSNNATITGGGGGIYTFSSESTITNNTIANNLSIYASGGGVYFDGGSNILRGNTLYGNSATGSKSGGGLYANYGPHTLTNNTFYNNTAGQYGGGLFAELSTNSLFTNNTFYNNSAPEGGGGIHFYRGTNTVTNNIFWDNKKGTNNNAVSADYFNERFFNILTFSYNEAVNIFKNNLLQLASTNYQIANTGNNHLGTAAVGNVFGQNPNFVNAAAPAGADNIHRTADDGWRLQAGSPCINAGTTTGAPTTDILGAMRLTGGSTDMGAYALNTTTLPVEWLDFTGTPSVLGNVLTWTTAQEQNNRGFQVERLATNGEWSISGFVKANNKASTYHFTDNTPLSMSYYRLRQVDNNGKESLSKVISIVRKTAQTVKVYPNPVANVLIIEIEPRVSSSPTPSFRIINVLGQTVLSGKTPDSGMGNIDVSNLPNGTYVVKVGTEQVKFIKQ